MPNARLRASQEQILRYCRGFMGIAAVPGSGKTWTLSQLASKLILQTDLAPEQEILIVTFSNSAADNFATRIGDLVRKYGLIEGIGYRVRTLHALASDIIHLRPELAGLPENFSIADESVSSEILQDIIRNELSSHPDLFDGLLKNDFNPQKLEDIHSKELPDLIQNLANSFISTAKDLSLSPENGAFQESAFKTDPIFNACLNIYRQYQAKLHDRGAVDFNDLIRLSLQCIRNDEQLRAHLHYRWPYILEDEAQDSSSLQQEILSYIAGPQGNWIRVGDSNQAINVTFTTANPKYLREFLQRNDVIAINLPESGRSAPSIIRLANQLILWSQNEQPRTETRDALSLPLIQATKEGDPQPNPPDGPQTVELVGRSMSSEEELNFLVQTAKSWLIKNPNDTIAILALGNKRVGEIAEALRKANLPVVDSLMQVAESTRLNAGAIAVVLWALMDPNQSGHIARAFDVYFRNAKKDENRLPFIQEGSNILRKIERPELLLDPALQVNLSGQDSPIASTSPEVIALLEEFRQIWALWQEAAQLPIDQMLLVIGSGLHQEAIELATVHKLSLLARHLQENKPEMNVHDLIMELKKLAMNERKFAAYDNDGEAFNPEQHRGEIVVSTVHKAKGLEWDKVFLSSVNNYDYPSGDENDSFISEKWYLLDKRNLQAEIQEALHALANSAQEIPDPKQVKDESRKEVIRERLRLLYVGITRARKSLTISWNNGRSRASEAQAIKSIRQKWEIKL